MLFTLQRYEFFSKSQPKASNLALERGCCLPYKGTNFSANHNPMDSHEVVFLDVVYPTKVRIFQQITTNEPNMQLFDEMLFTLQRYEFFSKSQLCHRTRQFIIRCCLPYKGTNFSANHNGRVPNTYRLDDVVYPTKVRIFQQITTETPRTLVGRRDVVYPTKVRIFQQITTHKEE